MPDLFRVRISITVEGNVNVPQNPLLADTTTGNPSTTGDVACPMVREYREVVLAGTLILGVRDALLKSRAEADVLSTSVGPSFFGSLAPFSPFVLLGQVP